MGMAMEFGWPCRSDSIISGLAFTVRYLFGELTMIPQFESRADVAIIAALPEELDALLTKSRKWQQAERDRDSIRTYHTAETDRGVKLVAATPLGMGQLNAALLAVDLVNQWNPSYAILVGMAAGVNAAQKGDIVVSDQIVDFEWQSVQDASRDIRWSVYRSDPKLLDIVLNLRNPTWPTQVNVMRPDGKPPTESKVLTGVILSGNKVIRSADEITDLKSTWSRAVGLEMEAAGIAASLYQRKKQIELLMVKGVIDRADATKDELWRAYGAHAAAALTWEIASSIPKIEHPTPEVPSIEIRNRDLRIALDTGFSPIDLKALVFDLDLNWDDLEGHSKTEKTIELIRLLQRQNRMPELVDLINKEGKGLFVPGSGPTMKTGAPIDTKLSDLPGAPLTTPARPQVDQALSAGDALRSSHREVADWRRSPITQWNARPPDFRPIPIEGVPHSSWQYQGFSFPIPKPLFGRANVPFLTRGTAADGVFGIEVWPKFVDDREPAEITLTVRNVLCAYVLITAGSAWRIIEGTDFEDRRIGFLEFYFDVGEPKITELTLGRNLREWSYKETHDTGVVDSLDDPNAEQVWRTPNDRGTLDMLRVDFGGVPRTVTMFRVVAEYENVAKIFNREPPHIRVTGLTYQVQ
jgi:nucleoside phosphorylase